MKDFAAEPGDHRKFSGKLFRAAVLRRMGLRWACVLMAVSACGVFAQSPQPESGAALINKYCVACHNQKTKTAGVALNSLDPSKPGEDAATWERVLRKVRRGEMPPAGLPRPDSAS